MHKNNIEGGYQMVKIFIDPGHGGNDPGARGNGLEEKQITLIIGQLIRDYLLENYQDVSVRMSRNTDKTVSLTARTNNANNWGADLYLSVHINAGGGHGFESFIFNGQFKNKSRTEQIRSVIHDLLTSDMSWRDRGKKEANFHVLRETRMPAVLTESGFIDHRADASNMRNNHWLESIASSHAQGIARAFNLKKKIKQPLTDSFYRVVSGSFLSEKNARDKVDVLKKKGYESYILPYAVQNERYYRVIVGAFRDKSNAERRVKQLDSAGFKSFIVED